MKKSLAILITVFAIALVVAQTQKDTPPLTASFEQIQVTQAGASGSLNIRNTGGKDIAAVGLLISFDTAEQKDQCMIEKVLVLDLYPGKRERLLTGDSFSFSANLPVKQGKLPGAVRITIDFVQYADGTTWGPDSKHLSRKIEGIREGKNLERSRLRYLYQKEGASAIAKELTPEPLSLRPHTQEKRP